MPRRSGLAIVLVTVTCVTLCAAWASAEDNEEKVPLKALPKNVVAVVKAVCPGGKMLSAEREVEREHGKTITEYEVKVKRVDGKIVEVEVELDAKGNIRKVQVGEDDDDDDDDD